MQSVNMVHGLLVWLEGCSALRRSFSRPRPVSRLPTPRNMRSPSTPLPLNPQSWWQVPGITPSIYASDPESMDAYKTTESRALKLKPGKYKFGSFTFDFPFTVNLEGKLEFAQSLDQCVEGRGTQTLTIRCSRTYPYGGQRDYQYQ